ncbi:MAG: ABC transporter substrate-binding protein [Myxacorys chilensis ATA2-1-KO14]|jgi:peptide/nickel transport system substrate-binding protein|nr:ABC transporter substrate-binding protein [Myxacorys chilensis ATA2-1-KO14]
MTVRGLTVQRGWRWVCAIARLAKSSSKGLLTAFLFAIALLLPFTLASCNAQDYKTQAAQVSQLVLTAPSDPQTFNYANNQSFPNIFLFTYAGLTKENGLTGKYEPDLAESWTISEDKKQVIFTLRPNLKWSDGMPLTADDVVFTYQDVVFNPDVPTDMKDGIQIGVNKVFPKIRKLDERRVEFTLPEPFAPLIAATAGPTGILIMPKHALEESVRSRGKDGNLKFISTWAADTEPSKIVTNGPYQLESYVPGQRMILKRNPYYWRKDGQGNPLPKAERIVWQIIENQDTQLLKFRSRELDVIGDVRPLRPEYFSLLKKEEKRGDFKVYNGGPWSGVLYMAFNLNQATKGGKPIVDPIKSRWFNNLAFRQAVAYGINRERINNNIFRGLGVIQNSFISVQSSFFRSPKEGLKVYNYDLQKAKDLLKNAGFKYDSKGQLFDAEGHRVRFTLTTNSNNLVRVGVGAQIRQDLSKLGMQVDYSTVNFNTLSEKLSTTRDWDAHIIGFTGGLEPHGLANYWMSSGASHYFNLAPQTGQPELKGWQAAEWEKEIDRLFIEGAREQDPLKRKKIYGDFQELVQAQLPVILLVNDSASMAVRDRVDGLKYTGLPSWGLWNIEELEVTQQK